MQRTQTLKLRLTMAELGEITKMAKEAGLSTSELVRSKVLGLPNATEATARKLAALSTGSTTGSLAGKPKTARGRDILPLTTQQCVNCLRKFGPKPECSDYCKAQRKNDPKAVGS
jgi:hypothetical protein